MRKYTSSSADTCYESDSTATQYNTTARIGTTVSGKTGWLQVNGDGGYVQALTYYNNKVWYKIWLPEDAFGIESGGVGSRTGLHTITASSTTYYGVWIIGTGGFTIK